MLNHPGIATIHGLEEDSGRQLLVMELVEGETLADRIARGALPFDEALPLFKEIAEALEAAHEKGVIHRDLKPANIKITPESKIKLLDFGLAKAFEPEQLYTDSSQSPTLTKGTALGAIMGTASYMSPEQARGKQVDKRTDVWAFGCCLYEALTGKKAFEGETVGGGREPIWSPTDNELFYRSGKKMMVVGYETEPDFDPGTPVELFEGDYALDPFGQNSVNYDVSPDGQTFVMVRDDPAQEIVVVLNWFEELKRLVPVN